MAKRFTYIPNRVIDTDGISDGASIFIYDTGTTTPVTIYSDEALTTPISNPYVVAAGAAVPAIYHNASGNVRVRIVESDGTVVSDDDPFERPLTDVEVASTASGKGASLVGVNGGTNAQNAFDKLPLSPKLDKGAAGDGSTDDVTEVNAALAGRDVVQIDDDHLVSTTVDIAFDQSVKGFGRTGSIVAGGSLTSDMLFRLNTNAGGTAWTEAYPNMPGTVIEDLTIDATARQAAGDKVTAYTFGGSPTFRNLRLAKVARGFKAVGIYNDKVRFENIHFTDGIAEQTSGEYLMELGLGDGITVSGFGSPQYAASDASATTYKLPNGIYTLFCAGGVFDGLINGLHHFQRSRAVQVNGGHFENGGILATDSTVSARDCVAWLRKDTTSGGITYDGFDIIPYRATTTDIFTYTGALQLSNCLTATFLNDWNGGPPVSPYDVQCSNKASILINGCGRWHGGRSDSVGETTLLGWSAYGAASAISAFNNYSHLATQSSRIEGEKLHLTASVPALAAADGLAAGGTSSKLTWQGANGTYYFRAQFFYDKLRLAGITGAQERSYAVTNGGNGIRLDITSPAHAVMVRIYYGTATNSYDNYIDLPFLRGRSVYFDGLSIGGYEPVSRSAGAVDTINTYLNGGFDISGGDNGANAYGVAKMWTASTTSLFPSVGSFQRGDEIITPNVTARYDGSAWQVVDGKPYTNSNMGDAALNIAGQRVNGGVISATTTLTADRTLTLPAPANLAGAQPFIVARTAGGAFNINVYDGTSTIQAIAADQSFAFYPTAGGYVIARLR